ncbi:hypothetical protein ACIQAC_40675 [Streptomyces sp. NPDC088387]|uniref:hypothetical protein n=1 Tax=Streptomyces sp. NPDC088387 TaxID=3365859 RepID=UPI003825D51B
MAIEHPVGGPPPTEGAAPSIRRAIALPLNEDDSGGGEASALISAGQAARGASAAASVAEAAGDATTARRANGSLLSLSGRTSRTSAPARGAAVPDTFTGGRATPGEPGQARPGGLFGQRQRRTTAGGLAVVPPAGEGQTAEGRIAAAAAEGAIQNRPGRTAAGHSGKRGRWPLMAAAFAGAMLVSVPFVNNPGNKNVTGLDDLSNTADSYASDMPSHEPQDGAASPLVPEPAQGDPQSDSGVPPLTTSIGPGLTGPSGDTTLDDMQPVPTAPKPGEPTAPDDQDKGNTDLPKNGSGFLLGGVPFLDDGDDSDDSTPDGSGVLEAPPGPLKDDVLIDRTPAKPLTPQTDAKPAKGSDAPAGPLKDNVLVDRTPAKPLTAQTDAKPASKPDPKPVSKPDPKPVSKPVSKPDPKPISKPVSKPDPKPISKPDPKPVSKPPATPDWSTKVVSSTYVLNSGQSVASNRMKITLRSSGNLVITDENGVVRWSSGTSGSGNRAVFQADGHFAVYSSDDRTLWSSGTAGNPGAQLVIQADGNVTIVSAGGAVLWSAGTQR